MKCLHCGNELKENSKFCDSCGAPVVAQPGATVQHPSVQSQQSYNEAMPMKKPVYKRWWFWVIIVAAVLLIGVINLAINGNKSSDGNKNTTVNTTIESQNAITTTVEETTEVPTTEEPTTVEPTTEKITEPPTEKPTESSYFTTGQTYDDGSLEIKFKSAEDYNDYEDYEAPAKGNKVIRAYFEIKNTGNSEKGIGSWDFSCYADDETVEEWYCYADDAQELESYVDLSKGRTAKGYIYYEVPKNAKSIDIEYTPTSFFDDEPVVFKVK